MPFDRNIKFVEHLQKDDCNEMQYIDPDEVRIKKLEKIVESWYDKKNVYEKVTYALHHCIDKVHSASVVGKYTPIEIRNALMEWFLSEDIIELLLTNYMENI